jgi:hypothetical protein
VCLLFCYCFGFSLVYVFPCYCYFFSTRGSFLNPSCFEMGKPSSRKSEKREGKKKSPSLKGEEGGLNREREGRKGRARLSLVRPLTHSRKCLGRASCSPSRPARLAGMIPGIEKAEWLAGHWDFRPGAAGSRLLVWSTWTRRMGSSTTGQQPDRVASSCTVGRTLSLVLPMRLLDEVDTTRS